MRTHSGVDPGGEGNWIDQLRTPCCKTQQQATLVTGRTARSLQFDSRRLIVIELSLLTNRSVSAPQPQHHLQISHG